MTNMKLPKSWDEVTLGQFQELSQVTTDDINDSINIISILTDLDSGDIMKMPITELKEMIAELSWMNILPPNIFKHTIKIDDVDYGIIPELNSLTVGEWVDLEEFITDYQHNIHKVMAVLYRPVIFNINDTTRFIEKYDATTIMERSELFKNKMMISDVYGASVFFSLIATNFIKNLNISLQKQTKEMKASMK